MITQLSIFNENNEQGIATFNDPFIIRLLENNLKNNIKYEIISDTECVITYSSEFSGDNSNMHKDIVNHYDGDYTIEIKLSIEDNKLIVKSEEYTFDGTIYQDTDDGSEKVGIIDITHTESQPQYMGDLYSDLVDYIKNWIPVIVTLSEFDGKLLKDSHVDYVAEIRK